MRTINEPVTINLAPDKKPARVIWRRRAYEVTTVHEEWRVATKWWIGEITRQYFRLTARDVYKGNEVDMKVYRESGAWILEGMQD